MADDPVLIAISLKSMQSEPYLGVDMKICQSAVIRGESSTRDATFTFQTGLLNAEQVQRCQELEKHGFTVVEAPSNWRYGYRSAEIWQDVVIQQAMRQVATIFQSSERQNMTSGYDSELAEAVLAELNKSFPHAVTTAELKHSLSKEPSDDALLTALDALQLEGFVSGKNLHSHTTSQRKLVAMANIQITAEGRRHLSGQGQQTAQSNAVVHGDQIINYGQAGAMGRNAIGTINYQQQWTEIESQTNLQALAIELEQLRTRLQQTASSRSDFQQLGLLAEAEEQAEKQEGSKVLEILSKAGKGLLDFAKEVGTDLTAKVIAKSMGLEP